MAESRDVMLKEMNRELSVVEFSDYCPNGLQVEGRPDVCKIVTGVTATQRLIDYATSVNADMLLVHHGYFWKGESPCVIGMKYQRLKKLITSGINLVAYHLPLDAHMSLGNNACLGARLGFNNSRYLSESNKTLGFITELDNTIEGSVLQGNIVDVVGRNVIHIDAKKLIRRVAWCTGAAQGFIEEAFDAGADAFISGEISEPTAHFAREMGIHYYAAGHHATERYGVQALGEWLSGKFDVSHEFFDDDNPA